MHLTRCVGCAVDLNGESVMSVFSAADAALADGDVNGHHSLSMSDLAAPVPSGPPLRPALAMSRLSTQAGTTCHPLCSTAYLPCQPVCGNVLTDMTAACVTVRCNIVPHPARTPIAYCWSRLFSDSLQL